RSEVLPIAGLGGLPAADRMEGTGPLIYAGHLIDPMVGAAELSFEQLRDAVVIVRLTPPAGVDPNATDPRPVVASLFGPGSPASAVVIVAEEAEREFWDYAVDVASKGVLSLAGAGNGSSGRGPPFFLITVQAVQDLLGTAIDQARQPRADLGT